MEKNSSENEIKELLKEAYQIRGSDIKASISLARKALQISQHNCLESEVANSLNKLSLFLMITGQYEESSKYAREAINYYKKTDNEIGIAEAKYSLSGIHYKTNNHHLGLIELLDCLAIYQKYNDYHNQARVQKSMGTIFEYYNDEKRAIDAYRNTLLAAKKANDLNLESNALNPLSGIYLNQGKIDIAFKMIEESIAIKKQTGDTRGYAFAIYGRGKIYIKTKEFEKAEIDLNESFAIHQRVGDNLGKAICYIKLGALYFEWGKYDKTIEVLTEGMAFGDKNNITIIKFKGSHLLYRTHKELGNLIEALEYLEYYLQEKEIVFNSQTQKIIDNYEHIVQIESKEKETKLQLEKAEILKKKNIAEQASRVKQDFLSTMSHEIRTPLNAIITISGLLNERQTPQEKELIETLRFSSNNLLLLINDILDFSKLEAGKFNLLKHPSDLKSLLVSIKKTYSSLAKEKGLPLNLFIGEKLASAYLIDETKLSQILGNLISNAIKFTESGRVDIEVIKKEEKNDCDVINFKIKDTGPGIEEEYIDTIFDSFSQSQTVTKRKVGGTGLGLAIVKKLVNLHGSNIYLDSNLGIGTIFEFDLILERTKIIDKAPNNSSQKLTGKQILLAEDNLVNAMVAKKLLSNWGIETDHAKNGIEAVKKAKNQVYDCILMDIHMPEMDGFEAVKIIKDSNNFNRSTPVLALTADITVNGNSEYNIYFNDFLLKPIEKEKLYSSLKSFA